MGYNERTTEVNIQGTERTWTRSRLVTCDNTYNKIPSMTFMEEDLTIRIDGKESHKGHATLNIQYDPTIILPLLNPETEQPFTNEQLTQISQLILSGNISHSLVFSMLFSTYMYSATERDKKNKK